MAHWTFDSSNDDIQNVQDKIDAVTTAIGDADDLSDADDKDAFAAKVDDADNGLQAMLDAEEDVDHGGADREHDPGEQPSRWRSIPRRDATRRTKSSTTPTAFTAWLTLGRSQQMHDGSKVTITVTEAGTPTGGAARTGEFKVQAAGPASISGGWTGQKFMRGEATDDPIEHLTVYTDIEAPKPMDFDSRQLGGRTWR